MRHAILLLLSIAMATAAEARCPERATTATFTAHGPFPVGVRTLALVDTTRGTPAHGTFPALPTRTLTTEVWYPAAADDPARLARGGPFPLVVNSHGLLDNRRGERYYAEALASWGFVVASPDFPLTNGTLLAQGGPFLGDLHNQPGDVRFIIDELIRRSQDRADPLYRSVDRRRIGATGLSLGSVTTLLATYHPTFRDRRIRAALPVAPGGGCTVNEKFFSTRRPKLLALAGEQDLILPFDANVAPALALVRSPYALVTLVAGTHTAFADLVAFPSTVSYDAMLGCPILTGLPNWGNPFEGLGGPENGFQTTDISCQRICQDPAPSNPPMQAARQHDLTTAVEVAFFASTLQRSRLARCFLRERLAAENADVNVRFEGRRRR